MNGKTQRFLGLDGLRGICAITVVLFHSVGIFRNGIVFAHGFLSVDVFFVLSGFVIALTYERRLPSLGLRRFLKARAHRLLPVYWAGNGIVVIIVLCTTAAGAFDLYHGNTFALVATSLLSMFLIPNLWDPSHSLNPENPAIWSLFGEWVANILYGRGMFRLSSRLLAIVVAAGWTAMTVAGFYTNRGWCAGAAVGDLHVVLLRAIPGFTMGVLLYRAYAKGLFDRLPSISVEWPFLAWIALAAIPTPGATPVLDALIATIAAPAIIVFLIRSGASAPAYCKFLGDISYPLYTVHLGFVLLATRTPIFGADKHPNPLGGIAMVAVSVAVAWGIAKLTSSRKDTKATIAVA